jgi:hypothetical protein
MKNQARKIDFKAGSHGGLSMTQAIEFRYR